MQQSINKINNNETLEKEIDELCKKNENNEHIHELKRLGYHSEQLLRQYLKE